MRPPTLLIGWLGIIVWLTAACNPQPAPTVDRATPSVSPAAAETPAATAADKVYKLGVIQLIPHPVLDTFRLAASEALAQQGFLEGKNLTIDYQNAQGDVNTASTIISKFTSEGVDAIFCITTPACIAAAKASSTIPIIFGYVTDPMGAGLVTQLKQPGGNITGVLVTEQTEAELQMIQSIAPAAKKVGVIWNQGEPNSQTSVAQLKQYAAPLNMEIIEANASTPAEVPTAAQSLVGRVDVIFVPGDNTAQSALPAIIQVCETSKIPLFTSDHQSVDQGAIAAYNFLEHDLGQQTGIVLAQVLSGRRPGDIDLEAPAKFSLSVNIGAASRMGITIPAAVLDKADRVLP